MAVLLLSAPGCAELTDEPAPDAPGAATRIGATLSADGVQISFSDEGSGELALLFTHGWSCDRSYWDAQADALSQHYRVTRVDLAGHGDSGAGRGRWTLEAFGEDVRAVADHLGLQRVILIGHSMGGPVSLEAARLLGTRVLGVIGVDSLHDADFKWSVEEWDSRVAAYEKDFRRTCDRFVRSMFLPDADPVLVSRVTTDMCSAPPEVAINSFKVFPHYDMAAAMARVRVPIRCVNAAGFPTNVEGNQTYADYDAVTMEGVGHFLMMERPKAFNRILKTTIESILN